MVSIRISIGMVRILPGLSSIESSATSKGVTASSSIVKALLTPPLVTVPRISSELSPAPSRRAYRLE